MKFPKPSQETAAPAPTPTTHTTHTTVDIPPLPHEVAPLPVVRVSAGPSDELLAWASGRAAPDVATGGMLANLYPRSFGH